MTLTRQEIAAVYRACERLEREQETYACWALDEYNPSKDLSNRFAEFYGKTPHCEWDWSGDDSWQLTNDCWNTRKNERIMALLFFAAAGGES